MVDDNGTMLRTMKAMLSDRYFSRSLTAVRNMTGISRISSSARIISSVILPSQTGICFSDTSYIL